MTIIHMETHLMRDMVRQLDAAALEVSTKGTNLKQEVGRLANIWQSPEADKFQRDFQNCLRNYDTQVQHLQSLALRVSREVDEWELADGNDAFGVNLTEEYGGFWPGIVSLVKESWDKAEYTAKFISMGVILSGLKAGTSYAGQVIFHGGKSFKEASDLSGHLTHIKAANIPKHLASSKTIKGLEIAGGVLDFAGKGINSWAEYDKGSEKTAALLYDAAFVTTKTAVKIGLQHWISGVAVGITTAAAASLAVAVLPAAIVPVAIAGVALITWWGVSWGVGELVDFGGKELYNWSKSSGFKDALVTSGGQFIEQTIEKVGATAAETAKAIDQAFDNVIRNVSMASG